MTRVLQEEERAPLVPGSPSSSESSYGSIQHPNRHAPDHDEEVAIASQQHQQQPPTSAIEDDVLPSTATTGRTLTWSSAYILIMSRVIGSGIFATPGAIVTSVGSVGLTLTLWVVGALFAWCSLGVALEYGCMLPRSGGHKVWLEFVYRRPRFLASTMVAVHAVLLGFTASNCIVFAEYVLFALGAEQDRFTTKALALALLSAVTVMHGCFLKVGIAVQNVLGWVKIGLVVFMAITSVFVVLFRSASTSNGLFEPTDLHSSWSKLWEGSVWNWGLLSLGFLKVFYSYAGVENVTNVLNEVKDPVRTLQSASKAALTTSAVLYIIVNIAYFLVVPIEEIKRSGELVAALFFEKVFGQSFGRVFLSIAISASAAGNVMVVTFALEIAKQGFLPSLIASSKPFDAPLGGLLVHYVPSVLVITIPTNNVYSFILDVEGYPWQIIALAISSGLLWLRVKRPDLKRPYKVFLPAVWLRMALAIALIIAPFIPRAEQDGHSHLYQVSYALVGTSVLLTGFLYWLVRFAVLPRLYGYHIEEKDEYLKDGTAITRLVNLYDTKS